MNDFQHLLSPKRSKVAKSAGILRRTGALAIDVLLLDIVVTAPFSGVFAGLLARAETQGIFDVVYTGTEIGAVAAIFLIAYGYFVMFEYVLGQTPGMMVLSLGVKQGRLWQHLVRKSFLIPLFPFMLFWIIEPLAILFYGQGALEMLSKTRTIHERTVLW